ncbi:hypothetical protein ES703_03861 [subsurface metagenome]
MIGLTGARVIVVDDDESDALPILKAFAKGGIPCAFFNGKIEELPEESNRFSGVRLAILDMDLVGGGVSDKSKATTLVSRIEKLLSPENGPYAVLVWTGHPELVDLFEAYIFSQTSIPKPIVIVMLTKDQCKDKSGEFDTKIVSEKLGEALSQFSPLQFLQAWEEKSFKAATEVTNILSSFAPQENDPKKWRSDWKSQLLSLMYAIAKEATGEHLDRDSALSGLYNSLNPLHSDRMESYIGELSLSLSGNSDEILKYSEDCGIEQKAKINTMLHLAFEDSGRYSAGNIYKFESKKEPGWVPSCDQLLENLLRNPETSDELLKVCCPVVIEVNAICDHAQKNIRIARFIGGLLVPASDMKKIKSAGFIWEFGPVSFNTPDLLGQYYFFFSARHLVTLSLEEAIKMQAFARLRIQALTALQAWFAQHAARPGLILLRA